MTQYDIRNINVMLEGLQGQLQSVLDGYKTLCTSLETHWKAVNGKLGELDHKLEANRKELKSDIVGVLLGVNRVDDNVHRVGEEAKNVKDVLAKLTELSEDHNNWLREHEVRIKKLEVHI